jgi:hypothetical protein
LKPSPRSSRPLKPTRLALRPPEASERAEASPFFTCRTARSTMPNKVADDCAEATAPVAVRRAKAICFFTAGARVSTPWRRKTTGVILAPAGRRRVRHKA